MQMLSAWEIMHVHYKRLSEGLCNVYRRLYDMTIARNLVFINGISIPHRAGMQPYIFLLRNYVCPLDPLSHFDRPPNEGEKQRRRVQCAMILTILSVKSI
jgi:hypothetical protein